MSADLMLICKDKNENYENNYDKCCFVDYTSMGNAWHDFGKIIQGYFWEEITDDFIIKIEKLFKLDFITHHKDCKIKEVIKWLKQHKGQLLETECW